MIVGMTLQELFKATIINIEKYAYFLIHDGGAGGEFLCNKIAENNPEFNDTVNNANQKFFTENRWGYPDLYLGNFFLKIGTYTWKHDIVVKDYDHLYELFRLHCFVGRSEYYIRSKLEVLYNWNDGKILFRAHDRFLGSKKFFPNKDKHTYIKYKSSKWRIYNKTNAAIKVFASPIKDDKEKILDFYKRSWNNYKLNESQDMIPYDIFELRMNELSTTINACYPMAHIVTKRLYPNLTWRDIVKIPAEELNSIKYYWENSEDKNLGKVHSKKWVKKTLEDAKIFGKMYCMGEVIHSTSFQKRFGVDIKDDIIKWHNHNLDLILKTEIEIGRRILPNNYNYCIF